jgi:hypothetical protein
MVNSLYAGGKINQSTFETLMPFDVPDAVFNPSPDNENAFRLFAARLDACYMPCLHFACPSDSFPGPLRNRERAGPHQKV